MQRKEFQQQLWLDFVHRHPDIGALDIWPDSINPEYLMFLTLDQGPFRSEKLLPSLYHQGYRRVKQYAMADRGLLVELLLPPDGGAAVMLAELQANSLPPMHRDLLKRLISQSHRDDCKGQNLLAPCRPWDMPDWPTFERLLEANPLAAWLSVMGPRLHHVGFNAEELGETLEAVCEGMLAYGMAPQSGRHHAVLPINPKLQYHYYPAHAQRMVFADGDEHMVVLGGIALLATAPETTHQKPAQRPAEQLLPEHTLCQLSA